MRKTAHYKIWNTKACLSCTGRAWKLLQNKPLVGNIGFDKTKYEPSKLWITNQSPPLREKNIYGYKYPHLDEQGSRSNCIHRRLTRGDCTCRPLHTHIHLALQRRSSPPLLKKHVSFTEHRPLELEREFDELVVRYAVCWENPGVAEKWHALL